MEAVKDLNLDYSEANATSSLYRSLTLKLMSILDWGYGSGEEDYIR